MNRESLTRQFAAATPRNRWKTFVLEAHADDATLLLQEAFADNRVEPTDDMYLHRIVGDFDFVVDHLDSRFWSFHTTYPAADVTPYLHRVVNSRLDLDWMWLPSDHLHGIWENAKPRWVSTDFSSGELVRSSEPVGDLKLRVGGEDADKVRTLIRDHYRIAVPQSAVEIRVEDEVFGSITERISSDGRFIVKGGNFTFHQAIVQRVVARYRRFVEAAESRRLWWEKLPNGGGLPHGTPIVLRFSRSIPDLDYFLDQLFSCRAPFRLWGLPRRFDDNCVVVEAVDLHVGQRLRFDAGSDWLRVYLFKGGCGNTVARLVSNLQHRFDGALSVAENDLQDGLKPSSTDTQGVGGATA